MRRKQYIRGICAGLAALLLLLAQAPSAAEPVLFEDRPAAGDGVMEALLPKPAGGALSETALEKEPPVKLSCKSALLMEPQSGQIIFEMNADAKMPVASVIKQMPILLAFEALAAGKVSLQDTVVASPNAAGMGGSQVLIDAGGVYTFEDLLKSMIVASANDATVAVGEHLYGSETAFVKAMNRRAAELGMKDTQYKNSTGLPAQDQYTTARDVARVSSELLRYEQLFAYSTIWMDELEHAGGRKTQLTNTNRMIRLYEGCDGLKTGSTNEAGYCVAATAKRGDMRLVAVVLGADSSKTRFAVAGEMLNHGFATYTRYPVAERGAKIKGSLKVEGGDSPGVKLMLDGQLSLLLEKGAERAVELTPELPEFVRAPISAGDPVGHVRVVIEGEQVARIPVVAAESVGRPSFFSALERVIRRYFYR